MDPKTRLSDMRGATLVEMLVAATIFLFVAIATYSAFHQGNQLYRTGEAAAEMQQRTRLAFDLMLNELRLAGFDFNRDGDENAYGETTDEQIEFVAPHAIVFRGNMDFGDGSTGREAAYELPADDPDYGVLCCPIVTTANDEIIAYALRSDDESANTGEIAFVVDTSAPRDGAWAAGVPTNEEDVVIEDVDLTDYNPPYTLMRFSLAADGSIVEQPVATGVRTLRFTYAGADGLEYWCGSPEADGSCLSANQVAFTGLGGADDIATGDLAGRSGRAAIRRIAVEFTGMTDRDELGFVDSSDTIAPHRRKLVLEGVVAPQNLGLEGHPDLDDQEAEIPEHVTACGGQCNTIRVEWDEVRLGISYRVGLFLGNATESFFVGTTPGIAVLDSSPRRVFAVFNSTDAPQIVNGAQIFARVSAQVSGDEFSPYSDPSSTVTLSDVVRPSAPRDVIATGYDPNDPYWPDVVEGGVLPDTANESLFGTQANQITISWVAPEWAMDVTNPDSPADSWTAQVDSSTYAALECDAEPADTDGDGTTDKDRTRLREMTGAVRYLVFRSTDPRFVPTPAHLVAQVTGNVDTSGGRVSYTDQSVHVFRTGIFNSTTNALENCKTYYYRVRAADGCWDGTSPASFTDPHLSPFHPALNPDASAEDPDDISAVSPSDVGLAIPGYSVPQARPKPPTVLRFTNVDNRTDDGDGVDGTIGFDAVKLDEFLLADGTAAFDDIVVSEYHLFSSQTNQNFTLADALAGVSARFDKAIPVRDLRAGRIAYDDENLNGVISTTEDETVPPTTMPAGAAPATALRVEKDVNGARWYKLAAVQCRAEDTVPSEDDPALYDYGTLSAPVKFPCQYGGGPYSSVSCNASNWPTTVTGQSWCDSAIVVAVWCRLVLRDRTTGDSVRSARKSVSGSGSATFSTSDIAALTDNFGSGDYHVLVEFEDSQGCFMTSEPSDQPASLPACCLTPQTGNFTRVTNTQVRGSITESCDAGALRIYKITCVITNDNGGQPDRFSSITYEGTTIWTAGSGNNTTVVIDRSTNPLIVGTNDTDTLIMNFNRSIINDGLTVTYDYRIGGQPGQCTFTKAPL